MSTEVMLCRYISKDGDICIKAISVKRLTESHDHHAMKDLFLSQLETVGLKKSNIMFIACDSVGVNIKALDLIRGKPTLYAKKNTLFGIIPCFAHLFNNAGKHLSKACPHATEFVNTISAIMSRSNNARGVYKNLIGGPIPSFSQTRW